MIYRISLLFLALITTLNAQWKNGDIIFSKTKGTQAIAVEAATKSPWTHTAVIYLKDGKPMVLEAVQPVQIITLDAYLKRGGSLAKHEFKRIKDHPGFDEATLAKSLIWEKNMWATTTTVDSNGQTIPSIAQSSYGKSTRKLRT